MERRSILGCTACDWTGKRVVSYVGLTEETEPCPRCSVTPDSAFDDSEDVVILDEDVPSPPYPAPSEETWP